MAIICISNTAKVGHRVLCSQTLTDLEHLWPRFIVGFGILDQQINVFSHGTDTPVVTQLKAKISHGHFVDKILLKYNQLIKLINNIADLS